MNVWETSKYNMLTALCSQIKFYYVIYIYVTNKQKNPSKFELIVAEKNALLLLYSIYDFKLYLLMLYTWNFCCFT